MVIHALTFARSRGRCWKPRPKAAVFNTSQGTWRMLMHWKPMFDCYYCIKTENICYISRYFLHYFVLPFHRCVANVISTDYARSRAGHYTSRDGSNSDSVTVTFYTDVIGMVTIMVAFVLNKSEHIFQAKKRHWSCPDTETVWLNWSDIIKINNSW